MPGGRDRLRELCPQYGGGGSGVYPKIHGGAPSSGAKGSHFESFSVPYHRQRYENKGLDVWAYKTALDSYGWAKLTEFDEIVMTNSTLMGPVRPLKEMFDAMWENQDLDFWGLSIHHGAKSNPFKGKHLYNYLPVHIQSHFIVYRQRFVKAPELQNYWDNMPMIESYTDSVQRYEAVFTKQFEDKSPELLHTAPDQPLSEALMLFLSVVIR